MYVRTAAACTLTSVSSSHTRRIGVAIGRHVRPGQVIALQGDLGAGKTTLTQGIAEGMGILARVTSPTFTLVNEYEDRSAGPPRARLIHIDTYRLGDLPEQAEAEAATFGLEEILDADELRETNGGAVAVIEWAERVASLLPDDRLHILLEAGAEPEQRTITLHAYGPQSAALLAAVLADEP